MIVANSTLVLLLWCMTEKPSERTCIRAGSTEDVNSIRVCSRWMMERQESKPTPKGYWACSFKGDKGPVYFRLKDKE